MFNTPNFIRLADANIAHYECGPKDAPAILFIHGWPLHAATYRHIVPALSNEFRCHLIDLPSTGKTHDDDGARVSIGGHTETILRVIEHLGLEDFAIIAHDSGGAFARFVAEDNDKVRGMFLMDTEIPHDHSPLFALYGVMNSIPGALTLFTQLLRFGPIRRSRAGIGSSFFDPRVIDGDFGALFFGPLIRDRAVRRRQARLLSGSSTKKIDELESVHAKISCPVHLVWGREDRFFPVEKARAMCSQFGGEVDFDVIERCGVLPHEEHPKAVLAHALPFLRRCLASGRAAA